MIFFANFKNSCHLSLSPHPHQDIKTGGRPVGLLVGGPDKFVSWLILACKPGGTILQPGTPCRPQHQRNSYKHCAVPPAPLQLLAAAPQPGFCTGARLTFVLLCSDLQSRPMHQTSYAGKNCNEPHVAGAVICKLLPHRLSASLPELPGKYFAASTAW